jgi:hypothetical protein
VSQRETWVERRGDDGVRSPSHMHAPGRRRRSSLTVPMYSYSSPFGFEALCSSPRPSSVRDQRVKENGTQNFVQLFPMKCLLCPVAH